jgi:hypothetical protein
MPENSLLHSYCCKNLRFHTVSVKTIQEDGNYLFRILVLLQENHEEKLVKQRVNFEEFCLLGYNTM